MSHECSMDASGVRHLRYSRSAWSKMAAASTVRTFSCRGFLNHIRGPPSAVGTSVPASAGRGVVSAARIERAWSRVVVVMT